MSIDFYIVTTLFLIIFLIGIYNKKKIKNISEYSVGERNFSNLAVLSTVFATIVGGGTTLGIAERAFTIGIAYLLVELISFVINSMLMAYYLGPAINRYRSMISVGDIMGYHFGEKVRILTGILATLRSLSIVGVQVFALGEIFSYILGVDRNLSVILSYIILIIYSTFGGIRSVIKTDILQFSLFIIFIPILASLSLDYIGGYSILITSIPTEKLKIPDQQYVYYFFMMITFCISCTPSIIQRMLLARDIKQVSYSMKITAIISIPFVLMIGILGFIAFIVNPDIEANHSLLFLIDSVLPEGFTGFVLVALVAATMSTADSDLNAASISITHDVIKVIFPSISEKKELLFAQITTAFMGTLALYLALISENMIDIIMYSYYFWAPIILVPFILAVRGARISTDQFWRCFWAGAITVVVWELYIKSYLQVEGVVPGVLISWLTYLWSKRNHSPCKDRSLNQLFTYFRLKKFIYFLLEQCKKLSLKRVASFSSYRVLEYGAQYKLFSIFGIINYIVPFFMWSHFTSDVYTVLFLRISASLACLCLYICASSSKRSPYLPLIWHLTLMYCLSFITTYLLIESKFSNAWLMNLNLSIFFLLYLVDWLSFVLIFLLGSSLAFFVYSLVNGGVIVSGPPETLFSVFYMSFFTLLIGIIFSRPKERSQAEKETNLKAMAGIIAHEMRTPLSSIYHAAYTLKDVWKLAFQGLSVEDEKKLPLSLKEYKEKPEIIENLALRSQANIDLLLANIRSLKAPHPYPFSINQTVDELLREYPQRPEIKIETNLDDDFLIKGDRQLVKQILSNLIKNSGDAMNQRGSIVISTQARDCTLTVLDEGKGMTSQQAAKVFDKFFTTKSHGTGLGLSFCKQAMDVMGGTIICQSRIEKGTLFRLHFPKYEAKKT